MKCNKCNAEWQVDASRSASITVCPFCQEKIETEKTNGWRYFDNTKELLEYIAAEYGNDALFGRKYFSDHSSPMMPQGQKNLVKQAFGCGAVKILQDNANADQAHKEIAVKQAVGKLIDTYASAKESAERVIWELTNAIGWGMDEPSATTPQVIKAMPQPLTSGGGALMIRAWQFAEDGDWKDAADYFNKVLDADPSYAPAFLGLICVELRVPREDELAAVKDPGIITGHKYYKRAANDPVVKARLDGYIGSINARIEAGRKAAEAEAERKRRAAEEAARRKRVQDMFDDAVKIMNGAKSSDDYSKAIKAFGSIDSNYQDLKGKIQWNIAECARKKAAFEDEFKKKYGFLLERYSAEGKAKAEERRKAERAKIDQENAKAKAENEARCLALRQNFDSDYKVWQAEVSWLKARYEAEYQQWVATVNTVKEHTEGYKSQGLCPHCGGTLKGMLVKKCSVCGKSPNDLIKALPAPPAQPNYPPEPKPPQMPSFTPRSPEPAFDTANDIEVYTGGDSVFVKSAGVVWRVTDVQGTRAKLRSDKGVEAYLEGDKAMITYINPLVRSNCDFTFYLCKESEFVYYFGFYADGSLISGSGLANGADYSSIVKDIKTWHSKGKVICKYKGSTVNPCESVDEISCSATSSAGTVDYKGNMDSNGDLHLDTYSHINNRRFNRVYKYIGAVKNGRLL